ncbi:MAG: gluconate 2-dehydrogenase subunit 3 family protein [Cyanobacteria bacterium K_Offshore_surface_m2_011]|nr:gluconate 2-dehydrogenase subunit 3 family protein [Cyanobacteria bacterium K_Offshore_surface_m2_011]
MNERPRQRAGLAVLALVVPWFVLLGSAGPSHSQPSQGPAGPSEAEEAANCERVSQIVTANSASVQEALEARARQRYGRAFAELSPEQMMAVSMAAGAEGRPLTADQRRLEERCAAWQRRVAARESTAAGLRSLFSAQAFLDRWGRERLAGLGCECPGFRLAGEDVKHRCETGTVCPGQTGGPRIPDPDRGCRTIGASAWIRQQLPDLHAALGISPPQEQERDAIAARERGAPPACAPLPTPTAPLPRLGSAAGRGATAPAAPAAIAAAAACFANPTPAACQEALVRGDALVASAQRAGRDRCLGYALSARTLWALGADPRFTDLLIRFPEAARLRNEARIALGYLRVDCRGL